MRTRFPVDGVVVIESRYCPAGIRDLDLLLSRAGTSLTLFDRDQAHNARGAYREYGKGRHVAGLNFGDCYFYTLAEALHEPLMCARPGCR